MTRALLIMALAIAASASSASAQCAEGRISTPETAGRCCWPGQTFADAVGRCSGPPACPSPLVAEGDTCLAPQPTSAPASAERATTAGTGSAPDERSGDDAAVSAFPIAPPAAPLAPGLLWPAAPDLGVSVLDPRIVHGIDEGLLITGLTFFGAGLVGAILIGVADQAARNCFAFSGGFSTSVVGCDSWPLALVPLAGGVLAGTVQITGNRSSSTVGIVAGPIVGILQLFGLGVLLHAAIFQTEDVVPGVDVGDARLSFAPYASDTEAGASAHVDF